MDEKLETARDYLLDFDPFTQEFDAAAEHVRWEMDHGDLKGALYVVKFVTNKRRNEKRAIKRLEELLTP